MHPLEKSSHIANIVNSGFGFLCVVVSGIGLWFQYQAYRAAGKTAASPPLAGNIMPHSSVIVGLLIAMLLTGVMLLLRGIKGGKNRGMNSLRAASAALHGDNAERAELHPHVVAVSYSQCPDLPALGLETANDGEPAYEISIPSVNLGPSLVTFEATCPRLTKTDRHVFWRVLIKTQAGSFVTGNDLRNEMIKQGIGEVPIRIEYKDSKNQWFATQCRLETDSTVRGSGVTVHNDKQELIEDRKSHSDLPQRMISLCVELEQFLNQLGPNREFTYHSGMSHQEFTEANKDLVIRESKMEAMFIRRFQPRVIDIYNEACETGTVHDAVLENLLRNQKMDHDDAIKGIIDRLRVIAGDLFSRGKTS